jgi:hypothetical protein
MFKLIGLAVVVAVIVIGFPSLQRWYAGDATPQQTVNDVRNSLGQKLTTEDSGKAKGEAAPAPAQKNETEAERVLRSLNEKK